MPPWNPGSIGSNSCVSDARACRKSAIPSLFTPPSALVGAILAYLTEAPAETAELRWSSRPPRATRYLLVIGRNLGVDARGRTAGSCVGCR